MGGIGSGKRIFIWRLSPTEMQWPYKIVPYNSVIVTDNKPIECMITFRGIPCLYMYNGVHSPFSYCSVASSKASSGIIQ